MGRLPVSRTLDHAGISMVLPLFERHSPIILMRCCVVRVCDGERIGRDVRCESVDLTRQRDVLDRRVRRGGLRFESLARSLV